MHIIRRNGNVVMKLVIKDEGSWDRSYTPDVMTFKTEKAAQEVANVWEDAVVELYQEEDQRLAA